MSPPTADNEEEGAAGWRAVGTAWGAEAVDRYQAFAADLGEVTESLAPEPRWHLSWLGVAPDQHGRGIGSSLVRPVTTRADAQGVAGELFTLAPRNVAIYEHLGFRVIREIILPPSGLRLWVMTRPPAHHVVSRF